jgi:hypothetical protein
MAVNKPIGDNARKGRAARLFLPVATARRAVEG